MRAPLTDMQQSVYDYIIEFIRSNRYPPTMHEICDHFNMSSVNSAAAHLDNLESKGYIIRNNKKARTLQLVDDIIGNYTIDSRFLSDAIHRLRDRGYKLDTAVAVEFLNELRVKIV